MATITIINGSVHGAAEELAHKIQNELIHHSHQVIWSKPAQVSDLNAGEAILVITSTTGQGDIPRKLQPFFTEAKSTFPLITGKPFGVIGLGDSSYENFCGAAEQMQELMYELQGKQVTEMLKIDAMETFEPETKALPWLKEWINNL